MILLTQAQYGRDLQDATFGLVTSDLSIYTLQNNICNNKSASKGRQGKEAQSILGEGEIGH